MTRSWLALLTGLCVLSGCSVLVNPDLTRLDPDASRRGDGSIDGARPDGALPDGPIVIDVPPPDVPGMLNCTRPCDDGIPCTQDRCDTTRGVCVSLPNPALCNAGERCDPTQGCVGVPTGCTSSQQCSDNNPCNGDEQCMGGRCVPGTPLSCDNNQLCDGVETCDPMVGCTRGTPPGCDDGNMCTRDQCDPSANGRRGACVNTMIAGCGMMGGTPANDLCTGAAAINLAAGMTATVMGTTIGANNGPMSDCGGGNGGDVWYRVTWPSGQDLTLEALPGSMNSDPVLSLHENCDGSAIACNDDAINGSAAARIVVRGDGRMGNRTLVVVVDSYQRGAEGPFTLRATSSPPAGNGGCEGTGGMDLSNGGTVLGRIPTRMPRVNGSCTPSVQRLSPEEAYVFSGAARRVEVVSTSSTFPPVLFARAVGCADGTREYQCQAGRSPQQMNFDHPGGTSLLYIKGGLPGATYELRVYPR